MTTTTTELTGFASIALIYALDSNPEGWVNEESLLDLAIGGGSGKRMINEVLERLKDDGLLERRRVGGRGFYRRTERGLIEAHSIKDMVDLTNFSAFTTQDDGMCWKPEPGNPASFDQLIGQKFAKNKILKNLLKAQKTGEMPIPMLLYGPSGSGKTLIAGLVSGHLQIPFISVSMADTTANELLDAIELAEEGAVLFLDELQAAKRATKNALLVHLDPGRKRNFAVIAATTDPGDLALPLRRRFQMHIALEDYSLEEAEMLVIQRSQGEGLLLDKGAALAIARSARSNPARITALIAESQMLVDEGELLAQEAFLQHLEETGRDIRGVDDSEIKMLMFLRDQCTRPAGMSKFVDVLGLDINFVREKLHFLREEHLVQNMGASGHSITRKGREYLESRHL
jgi:Holliday junction resolvasome RuvABC ATP-dependent DNA helicase subunit